MDADPPKLSQESQETASNQNVSVHELLNAYHRSKSKPAHPKQKRRPYSATICPVEGAAACHAETLSVSKENKAFIAVKGQNLSPQVRPPSGSHSIQSEQLYKGAYLLHLDPERVEQAEQVTLEGLRKYSAYGQDDDNNGTNAVPKPPCASPELPSSPADSSSDDGFEDIDAELELQSLSENSISSSILSRPLVFQIPTAELDETSDNETLTPSISRTSERPLSADYVEKSEVFLNELERKQTQEAEELSEMFNKMTQDQVKVDNIDLRSVLSTPSTARQMTTPTTQQKPSGVSVLTMEMEKTPIGGNSFDSVWVEEPFIPRIRNDEEIDSHVTMGRFHSSKKRVQSATTRRRQEEDTFVLRGKTFELFDAKDLVVSKRLSSNMERVTPSQPKKDEKQRPSRPSSAPIRRDVDTSTNNIPPTRSRMGPAQDVQWCNKKTNK
ncbi:hypothetical protein QZH41_011224 [Actinostola sp. cb2023]|nr:hypothetical protein QZH41_011224 [Actinostola sp. cb2023]